MIVLRSRKLWGLDVNCAAGPNSYLSICADPGVHWIASRIGASDYATCATSLTSTISRKLKLRERLSPERIPDPPKGTAWLYTKGKSRLNSISYR